MAQGSLKQDNNYLRCILALLWGLLLLPGASKSDGMLMYYQMHANKEYLPRAVANSKKIWSFSCQYTQVLFQFSAAYLATYCSPAGTAAIQQNVVAPGYTAPSSNPPLLVHALSYQQHCKGS